jgi:hypothetical protein
MRFGGWFANVGFVGEKISWVLWMRKRSGFCLEMWKLVKREKQ